jgi:flavin reductase (DIM6/NTAB) family NADH-FMN oxidoreductase RutF
MKRNIVYILLLIPIIAWAASTSLINPGNWNDSLNWSGGVIGNDITDDVDMPDNLNYIIIQSGDSYIISDMQMNNMNTLTIDAGGVLTIGSSVDTRNLTAVNNITLNIDGDLEIWGDLIAINNLILNVTGSIIVHGDLDFNNDAIIDIQGSVTVDGEFIGKDNNNVNVDGVLNITGNLSMGSSGVLTGNGTINLTGGCTSPNSFCSTGPLDVTDPVISNCPVDFSVSLTGADCDEVVNWTAPNASDNVSVTSFTYTHNSGDTFPVGITTVTYTATDGAGNMATCSFQVTVTDNTPPVISNCPTDIVVSVTGGSCDEVVNWVAPTRADNCSIASFNSTHNSGDTFSVGTTVVSYIATDPAGNVTTCTFNVTVDEDTDPVITGCPADIVVSVTGGDCDEIVNWIEPTPSDNCSVASFNSTHNSGDAFPAGITAVTYTVTDNAGNMATCSFQVTVNDNTPPIISNCPADVVVNLTGGSCDKIVNWIEPTPSDNCNVASFNRTHNPGDIFPVGTTVVR